MEHELHRVVHDEIIKDLLKIESSDMLSIKLGSCQWLLHRYPLDGEYYFCRDEFPSQYVTQIILRKALRLRDEFHWEKVSLGQLYEADFFDNICKIGYFIYASNTNFNEKVSLRIAHLEVFTNKEKITSPKKYTLYRPDVLNKPGVDAVYIDGYGDGWFLQVTINPNHKPLIVDKVHQQFQTASWKVCCIHPHQSC